MTQFTLSWPATATYNAEDFILSDVNREAWKYIQQWPDWQQGRLLVHGPAGCGKTHLASVWAQKVNAVIVPPSELSATTLEKYLGTRGAYLIDGLEYVEDMHSMFHLVNHIAASHSTLLVTSSQSLKDSPLALPDLQSRLLVSTQVAISAPDDVLLAGVIGKLFADRQLKVSPDIIQYMVTRMERSFAEANRLVGAIDAAALADRRNITLPLVRGIFEN